MGRISQAFVWLTGNEIVESVALKAVRVPLRVLTYHDVVNVDRFASQIQHLVARYEPVTGRDISAAIVSGRALPRRAVWVTFDDGYPGVVELAQPVLDEHGVRATMFVCPGLIDTTEPFWWDIVREALALGLVVKVDGRRFQDDSVVKQLKRLPDEIRRNHVAELRHELEARSGEPVQARQLTSADLAAWTAQGHELGNHTWDHPCLDQCTPAVQLGQIAVADEWLATQAGVSLKLFAYPNGNWSAEAEHVLANRGYQLAVIFDHKTSRLDASQPELALRLSRLRVSADADIARFRSIVSGVHSITLGAGVRISPRRFGIAMGDRG